MTGMVVLLGRRVGGIGQKHEGDVLGKLFGEGIVEDKGIHASLVRRDVIGTLGDSAWLTCAVPRDWLQTYTLQFLGG